MATVNAIAIKAHVLVIGTLRKKLPVLSYRRERKKREMIKGLQHIYDKIQAKKAYVVAEDFPEVVQMQVDNTFNIEIYYMCIHRFKT